MDDRDIAGLPTAPLVVGQPVPRKTLLDVMREAPPPDEQRPLTFDDLMEIARDILNPPPHPARNARQN